MTAPDHIDSEPGWGPFLAQLAAAADLCLKPRRHAVLFSEPPTSTPATACDLLLRIEAREPDGARAEAGDLELEIYRSGRQIHLMLASCHPETAPLLWQGPHPVWMDASSGERCAPPLDGARLEALARRIRALVALDPAG